jgi:hypothetical protein
MLKNTPLPLVGENISQCHSGKKCAKGKSKRGKIIRERG